MSVFIALIALLIMVSAVEGETKLVVTIAGIWGLWFMGVKAFRPSLRKHKR